MGSGVTTITKVNVDTWDFEHFHGLVERKEVENVGTDATVGDLQVILWAWYRGNLAIWRY